MSAVDGARQFIVRLHAKTEAELRAAQALLAAGAPLRCSPPGSSGDVALAVHEAGAAGAPTGGFDVGAYMDALATQRLGRTLLTAAELPSTQSLLQENRGALPDGALCVVDRQTSGKGRGGNAWTSPPGCLMFSLACGLRVAGQTLPFVQYAVCIAAVEAVHAAAAAAAGGDALAPLLRIKWPNDLYSAAGLKVGGILCNSAYKDGAFSVAVGVGLNLDNAAPTTCVNELLAAQLDVPRDALPGGGVSREALLAGMMGRLEVRLEQLAAGGFAPMRDTYLSHWLHMGQKVVLEEAQDGGSTRRVPLTITGLTDGGYLLAADARGQRFELHPDGNSLDFFQGLVRKKVGWSAQEAAAG